MIKRIIIFLLLANLLYSDWNRRVFVILNKINKEICKKIRLWTSNIKEKEKYFLSYKIYFNEKYAILIR